MHGTRMRRLPVVVLLLVLLVAIPVGFAPGAAASAGGETIILVAEGSVEGSTIISADPCPDGWKGVIIGIGDDTQVLWACTNIIP